MVDMATDQLVAPAMTLHLDQAALREAIPDIVLRYFQAMLRLNRGRNRQLRREAKEIATALNTIEIVPIFLKGGAGLLSDLYEDIGIRVMSDLDILIPGAQAKECAACLETLGYFAVGRDSHPFAHSLGGFVSDAAIAPIDLHQEALAYPCQALLPGEDVIAEAVVVEYDGCQIACPDPTHQLILNIGHAQLNDHARAYAHLPLRALYDYRTICEKWSDRIDWHQVEDRFRASKNWPALEYHGLAAEKLLAVASAPARRPGIGTRLQFRRAAYMVGHPRLQAVVNRFIRVGVLLKRELSSSKLRRRLLRNLGASEWWRRHFRFFLAGNAVVF